MNESLLKQALESEANDLRTLVNDYYPELDISTWRASSRISAPWRGGDNPSVVSINRKTMHDFKTGESFNALSFLTDLQNSSKSDAAKELIARADLSKTPFKKRKAVRLVAEPNEAEKRKEEWKAKRLKEAHAVHKNQTQGISAYLQNKGVATYFKTHSIASGYAYGEETKGKFKGNYIQLPLVSLSGEITGYQRLYDDGSKEFIGKTKGSFILLRPKTLNGLPDTTETLLRLLEKGNELGICEGFATALSICMARPKQIMLCALNAGNLEQVAFDVRKKYGYQRQIKTPDAAYIAPVTVTIWADNDVYTETGNAGQLKAHSAALKNHMQVRTPNFKGRGLDEHKPTDFNDLHVFVSLEAINKSRILTPDKSIVYAKELADLNTTQKYLGELPKLAPNSALLVKAPKETGKTEAIALKIKAAKALGLKVCAVVHRQSLATGLANRLGIQDYQDIDNPYEIALVGDLVISFDSLNKLALSGPTPHYDVLIIDESEQVLRHVTGRHIKHKKANLNVLEHYMKACSRIICLDADLGPVTLKALDLYTPEKNKVWHTHNYAIGKDRNIEYVFNREEVFEAVINADDPVFYSSNSIKRTRAISEYLAQYQPHKKLLVVNSETMSRPEVKAYLANPTKEAKNYDVLICSPSISTGLSDDSGHWQTVIGDYPSGVGTWQDYSQALARARNVKNTLVYVDYKRQAIKTEKQILQAYEEADKLDAELLGQEKRAYKSKYSELKSLVQSEESKAKSNPKASIIKDHALQGYDLKIKLPEFVSEDLLAKRKLTKNLLKELELERYASDRAEATRINEAKAKVLKDKQAITEAEIFELEQWEFRDFFCLAGNVDTEELKQRIKEDDHGKLRRKVRLYEEAFKPLEYVKNQAEAELEKNDLLTDLPAVMLRHEFYTKLAKGIGLNESVEAKAEKLGKKLDQLQEEAKAITKALLAAKDNGSKGKLKQKKRSLSVAISKLERVTNTLTYNAASLKPLMNWIIKNYNALDASGIKLSKLSSFKANPLAALSVLLRDMGLKQNRVGANEDGSYAVTLTSVYKMFSFSRPRRQKYLIGQQNIIIDTTYNISLSDSPSESINTRDAEVFQEPCQVAKLEPEAAALQTQTITPEFEAYTSFTHDDIDKLERYTVLIGEPNQVVKAHMDRPEHEKLLIYPQIVQYYGLSVGDRL